MQARVGCYVDEPLRSGGVESQRLLADHMLARRQSSLGKREVQVVRRADVHDVDTGVRTCLGRVEGSVRAELGGPGQARFRGRRSDARQLRSRELAATVRGPANEPGACNRRLETHRGCEPK